MVVAKRADHRLLDKTVLKASPTVPLSNNGEDSRGGAFLFYFIMSSLLYLVIHCTATPEGREVSAAEIRHWHTAPVSRGGRGWKQVGYTDMIHLDGRVERLVQNNEDAMVDPWEITNGAAGYNAVSRHIVYVGGCDRAGKPKDTRTEAQREALKRYVQDFHLRFPQIRIVGHHELNPSKACPCFDVREIAPPPTPPPKGGE